MTLPVPTPRTWSVGDIASSSLLNSNLRDSINFGIAQPVCRCYMSTTQSVSNGAWNGLSMDTNLFDTYSGHSTSVNNSEYVAQITGYYLVIARASFANNTTGLRGAGITTNGAAVGTATPQVLGPTTATSIPTVECVDIVQMSAGQYVQAIGFQSSGGALATNAGTSSLTVFWIHS